MISPWQKSQVCQFSDCFLADFGPRLPANQLYNNLVVAGFVIINSQKQISPALALKFQSLLLSSPMMRRELIYSVG